MPNQMVLLEMWKGALPVYKYSLIGDLKKFYYKIGASEEDQKNMTIFINEPNISAAKPRELLWLNKPSDYNPADYYTEN